MYNIVDSFYIITVLFPWWPMVLLFSNIVETTSEDVSCQLRIQTSFFSLVSTWTWKPMWLVPLYSSILIFEVLKAPHVLQAICNQKRLWRNCQRAELYLCNFLKIWYLFKNTDWINVYQSSLLKTNVCFAQEKSLKLKN